MKLYSDSIYLHNRLKEINEKLRVINIKTMRLQKEESFRAKKEQEEMRKGLDELTAILNSLKDKKINPLEALRESKEIDKVKDISSVIYEKMINGDTSELNISKIIESKIEQIKKEEEERKIRLNKNMEELAKESQKVMQEKNRLEEELKRIMNKWEKEFNI